MESRFLNSIFDFLEKEVNILMCVCENLFLSHQKSLMILFFLK